MRDFNLELYPLRGFNNWAYDVREITPGFEQVNLYRDSVLRFTASVTLPQKKMQQLLLDTAAQMEFDIQRRFSQRLYGFDAVRTERGVIVDMANESIRRYLEQYAISLKKLGVSDCGMLLTDVHDFLKILEETKKQVLAVEAYEQTPYEILLACGEVWRVDDMRTPTLSLFTKNFASLKSLFLKQGIDSERQTIYSFVIDSREVVEDSEGILARKDERMA